MPNKKSDFGQTPAPEPAAAEPEGLSAGAKLARILAEARAKSGLSLAQVSHITKIQARFLDSLENGRLAEVPSPAHIRAFSLALMKACQGDEGKVLRAWAELTTPVKPPEPEGAPAPVQAPEKSSAEKKAPREALPSVAPAAMEPSRPRHEPKFWMVWLAMAAGVVLVLWVLSLFNRRPLPPAPGPAAMAGADIVPGLTATADSARPRAPREKARAESLAALLAKTPPAPLKAAESSDLALRARQKCWLSLKIDGEALPVVTLTRGEKRVWKVGQKAVLLAGNLGALRVWWEGNNLGYLGPKGERANGLVFEAGKKWHKDSGQALPLPEPLPGAEGSPASVEDSPDSAPDAPDQEGLGSAN